MVEDILVSFFSGLIGGGGLGWWLVKRRIDYKYNEKLEEFRSKLARLAHEHEVRFGTLHERRVDVIAQVYARLERLHMTARHRAVYQDTSDEASKAVYAHLRNFVNYYYPHAIWLGPELNRKIGSVFSRLNILVVWGERVSRDPKLVDMIQQLEQEIGELRKPLEAEFRSLLAVNALE